MVSYIFVVSIIIYVDMSYKYHVSHVWHYTLYGLLTVTRGRKEFGGGGGVEGGDRRSFCPTGRLSSRC
jgi:hypothetical protein